MINDDRQTQVFVPTTPGKRWVAGLAVLLACVCGCQQPQLAPNVSDTDAGLSTNTITVRELASRLRMRVGEVDDSFVRLADASNTVLVFTHQGGKVYVNGVDCGPAGVVERSGGTVWVDPVIADRIRTALRADRPGRRPDYGLERVTVVLDPGHGGKDPGAISPLGFQEKAINLEVAKRLATVLNGQGFRVIMTRDTDVFLELEERAEIANGHNADLFVSIHADSAVSQSLSGYTVYIARAAGDRARWVARAVAEAMASSGIESNGVREADYRVLVRTRCPAVLVELGYISNHYEAARLRDPYVQQRLAQAIAEGLARCMGK